MNHKERIIKALEGFSRKNSREPRATNKKNKSPEKDIVKELLSVGKSLGMSLHVVESKATFSQATGRYTGSAMRAGIPDIIGCDADGFSVWIEAKAKGRKSTLRDNQREFLEKKISSNCFAVVLDCAGMLESTYKIWKKIGRTDQRQSYLKGLLPTKRVSPQKNQIVEELGF
jgi:hypothetical protein